MKNTENIENTIINDISLGSVYVMTHSFFSDVVKIGCTIEDPQVYAKTLSAKTIGEYSLAFSLRCSNPCKIQKQIKHYLNAQEYVNGFYQVSPDMAKKLLKRETLKIPSLNSF
jgi:hypothetical protein